MRGFKTILLSLFITCLASCQKVVNVDLETAAPKLVIDAAIDWQHGTKGNEQTITLSTTYPYFSKDSIAPKVSGAKVTVTDSLGKIFDFEQVKTGEYVCNTFSPTLNMSYTLRVDYQGKTYTAKDKLYPMPQHVDFQQKDKGGIFGNAMEIRGFFKDDDQLKNNYYLVKIKSPHSKFPAYIDLNGKFFSKNNLFFIYSDEKLKPKDTLNFEIYRISEDYFGYMYRILEITSNGSSPFSTPPASVIGNIINNKDANDNPLGAFRATQFISKQYIIK
ncbi:DUF4249 domain-containing protein [Capnocytophaga canimorsus]|uniref:DUF4249 domain-containing protein n=1 Tax=Capnocytophaga canimorsus TaxID=28188 RepID=UPI00385F3E00